MMQHLQKKRFTLVQKLLVSYGAMTVFTMAALIASILGIYSLNKTAREIARKDLVFINTANRLRDSIVAQERYAGKYAILKGPEFAELFRRREADFLETVNTLDRSRHLAEKQALTAIYGDFRKAAALLFAGKIDSMQPLQKASNSILTYLDNLYNREQQLLNAKLESADRRESSTVRLTLILSFTGFLLAIVVAALSILNISAAIAKLKKATQRIAEGDFDFDPDIPPGDEIGALAEDFSRMAERLKVLEQICLDASPLTRLPGNIAIERVLSRRLAEAKPFAVCYADLDNFKAYNDRYGYIKASEVIKITGEIIYEAVKRCGDPEAFIGHVGGDDFVMVVDCDLAEAVCSEVIAAFDREIVRHYSPEDLAKGAIEGIDRYGVPRVFPIMTISIVMLICNAGEYADAVDIAKTAAQLKDHAKGMPGSNYFVNRRRSYR